MKPSFFRWILIGLKGMAMGAADVVPGVSGGTIAFISGIYEELIESIRSLNVKALKILFGTGLPAFWKHVNGNFLLAVLAGILISVITLARILEYLLINHPVLIWSFFFGLIISSAVYVARTIKTWTGTTVLFSFAGIIVAYLITSITPAESTEAYWFIFLSGALAICAMILPGISGSFILLLLGKYQFVLNAVNEAKISVIAVLGLGAVVGLISFSNLLSWLLRKYHNLTIAVLAGFMIGSLNKIWPWKVNPGLITGPHGAMKPLVQKNVLPMEYLEQTGTDPQLLMAVVMLLAGSGLILIFEWLSKLRKP